MATLKARVLDFLGRFGEEADPDRCEEEWETVKAHLHVTPESIACVARSLYGDGLTMRKMPREARDRFLYQLLQDRWDWEKQSREDFVAWVTDMAEAACEEKENFTRNYGGNPGYAFERLYGKKEGE